MPTLPPPRPATPGSALARSPAFLAPRALALLLLALAAGLLLGAIAWDEIFDDTPPGGVALVLTTVVILGFSAGLRAHAAIGVHRWTPAAAASATVLAVAAWLLPSGAIREAAVTGLVLLLYAATLALFSRRPYDGSTRLEAITVSLAVISVFASLVALDGRATELDVIAILQLVLAMVGVMAATGMVVSQGWIPTTASALVLGGSLVITGAMLLAAHGGEPSLAPGLLVPLGTVTMAGGYVLGDEGIPAPDRGRLAARILVASVAVMFVVLIANGLREEASTIASGCALIGLTTAFARVAVRSRGPLRTDPSQLGGIDRLTGLPDRYELEAVLARELEHAARHRQPVGLAIIDVVSLHEINETLGHRVGDHVLREFAASLAVLADCDVVVRLSGASFAIVLRGHGSEQPIRARLETLLAQLPQRLELDELSMATKRRSGLAFFPAHATTVADLLRRAEIAVQGAKDSDHELLIYDPARDARSRERLQLAAQLREGIQRDELRVFFQPKIDMASGVVIGAEALVRWRHPDGHLLTPDKFLPMAESTGQMDALTNWVLDAALREVQRWRAHGFALHVAVNISAEILLDTTLPGRLRELLARHELRGSSLELEITEELAMADPARTAEIVAEIKEQGIGFALDDFGTGYSSLSHLKHLGADVLKIDRSFVRDMAGDEDDRVIVWSILDLARNLGMRAVAEGIESPDAVAMLAMMGCSVGQGFHYARPLDADAFLLWCMEQQRLGTIRLTAAAMEEQGEEPPSDPSPAN